MCPLASPADLGTGSFHVGIRLASILDVPAELIQKVMKNHGHFEQIHTNSAGSFQDTANTPALDFTCLSRLAACSKSHQYLKESICFKGISMDPRAPNFGNGFESCN